MNKVTINDTSAVKRYTPYEALKELHHGTILVSSEQPPEHYILSAASDGERRLVSLETGTSYHAGVLSEFAFEVVTQPITITRADPR